MQVSPSTAADKLATETVAEEEEEEETSRGTETVSPKEEEEEEEEETTTTNEVQPTGKTPAKKFFEKGAECSA